MNPGLAATDDDLRALRVEGFRPPQQHRTVETTRRLMTGAWEAMVQEPMRPIRLDDVLGRTGVGTSSFYARFDDVEALVEAVGLLADPDRTLAAPSGADHWAGSGISRTLTGELSVEAATRRLFDPVLVPGALPREVLAVGVWREGYVSRRQRSRLRATRDLAASVPEREGAATLSRTLTWLHLVASSCDVAWMIGSLALDRSAIEDLVARTTLLGRRLLDTDPAVEAAARQICTPAPERVHRTRATGVSDRSVQAVTELRTATRDALVEHGGSMVIGDIARSVHRSRAAFTDAFGTLDAALADLARAEQVARIPTELFRPRDGIPADRLIPHLARRIRAWQDHQGILGRRLLQASGSRPQLATEIVGQVQDSAELLGGWYGPQLDLGPALARLVFIMVIVHQQNQVLWGPIPDALTGPEALGELLAPIVLT